MKGDERGKPQISIPQKSAVAIVPPKKVRTFGYGLDTPNSLQWADPALWAWWLASLLARIDKPLTLSLWNRLSGRFTTTRRRTPKS
jgi:hypothetical protein